MIYELVPELKQAERGRLSAEKFPELRNVIFIGPEKHRGMYSSAELLLVGSQRSGEELQRLKNGWGIEPHPFLPNKAQAQNYPLL